MKNLTTLMFVFVLVLCATSLLVAQDKKFSPPPVEVRAVGEGQEVVYELASPPPPPVMSSSLRQRGDVRAAAIEQGSNTIYLAEGFEGPWTFGAPPGWTAIPATNTDSTWHRNDFETGWTFPTSGRLGAPVAPGDIRLVSHMGGYSARFHSYGAAAGTRGAMISPVFDASTVTDTLEISFWWLNGDGTDPLTVYYSTDGGTSWTSIGSVGATFAPWAYAIGVIPPPYTSTMAVKFEATSDFGVSDIGLDEVLVYERGPAYSGAATLPGTFSSFSDAVRKLRVYGVSGPLTITVTPGVYTDSITVDPVPGASATNTVTFLAGGPSGAGTVGIQRSGALTYAGAQNTFDATIILMGCQYVTFDGVDIITPPGGLGEFGYMITNEELVGSNFNTIKNSTVTMDNNLAGSTGIAHRHMWQTTAPGVDAFNQKNNTYLNNLVQSADVAGMRVSGAGAGGNMDRDNLIDGNTIFNIGRPGTTTTLHAGLMISGQKDLIVRNNDIDSIWSRQGSLSGVLFGVTASTGDSVVGFSFYRNQIRRIHDSTTTALLVAIRVNNAASAAYRGRIFNNFISDFRIGNSSTAGAGMAFYIQNPTPGVSLDIDYNTVLVDNTVPTVGHIAIFRVESGTQVNLRTRNNIFINKSTSAGDAHIHRWSSSTTPINFVSSNNTYYIDTTIATRYIGRRGTTTHKSLPAWQAVTGQDAYTSFEDVAFVNATTKPYDLHVNPGVPSTTESGGISIAGITTDFDGDPRNASFPDIGADEYSGTAVDLFGPYIVYAPLPAAPNTGDRILSTTISDPSGVAGGANSPRLYYKKSTDVTWQFDASPTGVPPAYNFTISAAALGGVSVGDVIEYYVAAQDLNATPGPNLSTNPAGGAGVSPPGTTPPPTVNSYVVSTTISSFPYLEDFEDSPLKVNVNGFGWFSQSVAGGANDWVRATPAKLSGAWSGTKAYVTNATANYSLNHNAAVYSPVFDFSAVPIDPVLRFYHNFDTEANWDGAVLEISTDGGYTWTKHDPVLGTGPDFNTANSFRWYNNSSTSGPLPPPKWSGQSTAYASQTDTGYIQSVTTLTGTMGLSDVRLRWRFVSDGSIADSGWVFDDVEVIILDLVPPVITYTKFDTTASLANRTLVATITDNVAVASGANAPRLYYKKSTDASYAFVNPTSVAGDQYTFMLDYSLIGGVSGGELIQYYVAAQDDPAGNVTTNPAGGSGSSPPGTTPPPSPNVYLIELTVSTFPYTEDFEDPPAGIKAMVGGLGWHSRGVRGTLDGWTRIAPAKPQINAAHSGTKCFVTEAAATYTVNYDAVLNSPVFNFSSLASDPFLEFWFNFRTERDWDGFIVQYSTDGGSTYNNATWVKQDPVLGTGSNFNTVNSQGWYNDGVYNNVYLPGGAPFYGGGLETQSQGSCGYATASNCWVRASTKLVGLAGQSNVRIRFYFSSDESVTSEGVAIDDVSIQLAPANDIGVVSLTSADVVPPPNSPLLKGDVEERAAPSLKLSLATDRPAVQKSAGQMTMPRARFLEKHEMLRYGRIEEQPKPAGVMAADLTFDAIVANFGTNAQATYSVGWAFDGTPQPPVANTDILDPGDDDTLALSYLGASPGIHNARAWSILSGDQNATNDTTGLFTFEVFGPEVVFYQGYESGTFPPPGWITVNADGGGTTGPWFQGGSFVFAPYDGMGKASGNYLGANGFYIDEWLISPNTGGLADAQNDVDTLVFWLQGAVGPWPDSVMILVSTTGTNLGDFTTILDYVQAPQGGWGRFAYVLPNAANRYIAFRYLHYDGGPSGNSSNFMGLDRVQIIRCFGCGVQTVNVPVGLNWNILSLPVSNPVGGDSVRQVYTNSAFPYGFAFTGAYVQQYVMANGPGYWIKSTAAYNEDITGTPLTSLAIPVASGWNMIGSRTTATDTGCVVWGGGAYRASSFFGYTGGYNVVTSLAAGSGFWVKSGAAGTITLQDCPLGKSQPVVAGRSIEELNSITIRDANGGTQTLYFGTDANGEIPVEMYAMPPAPPEGSFDARFESVDGGTMVQTHPAEVWETIELPIAVRSSAYPLTVAWKINGTEAAYELRVGEELVQTLRGEGKMHIGNGTVNRLSLRVLGGSGLPKEYALWQNYPNPFNPTTTVRFALPVDSKVTMEIYNILGQRVATLVNEVLPAGYHSVEWNGTGTAGQAMGSGVYFLRIAAKGTNGKDFTDVKKLMLVK